MSFGVNDLVKVLEGIEPKPRIPYYTYVTLEDGTKLFYRPDGCSDECCNESPHLDRDGNEYCERDRCTCTGHWEEWGWGRE